MLYESYPIAFINDKKIVTKKDTLEALSRIVRLLHQLDDKIYEHEEKDLVDIKFYLTELYYEMKNN